MITIKRVISLTALAYGLALTYAASSALAQQVISYQAKVEVPAQYVNTWQSVTFSIFSDSSAGLLMWSETDTVPIGDGKIESLLGLKHPLPDFDAGGPHRPAQQYYLDIKIGDFQLTPRWRIGAAPTAWSSQFADTARAAYVADTVLHLPPSAAGFSLNSLAGAVNLTVGLGMKINSVGQTITIQTDTPFYTASAGHAAFALIADSSRVADTAHNLAGGAVTSITLPGGAAMRGKINLVGIGGTTVTETGDTTITISSPRVDTVTSAPKIQNHDGTLNVHPTGTGDTLIISLNPVAHPFIGLGAVDSTNIANGAVSNANLKNSGIFLVDTTRSLTINGGGLPIYLGGTGTIELNLANANTWTAPQTFSAGATAALLTVIGMATTHGINNTGTLGNNGNVTVNNGNVAVTGTVSSDSGYQMAGAAPSGNYLRGNGTSFVSSAIQPGDITTLNQNTTGTASNVTGIVAVGNGGTGTSSSPTAGSVIYGASSSSYAFTAAGTAGQVLTSSGIGRPTWANLTGSAWGLTGNAGTTYGTNFIGTTDSVDLQFKIGGQKAGLIEGATSGDNQNTGFGYKTFLGNTSGTQNVAIGFFALMNNTSGNYNTASGAFALQNNTTGNSNTASGYNALERNTTGFYNMASGGWALYSNTTGFYNTAGGYQALDLNTTGQYNMASGYQALYQNTTGSNNTASGDLALQYNTTGSNNTASGWNTLKSDTSGNNNTAIGYSADVASGALTNATAIGANAQVGASNSLVLGSINGINGATANTNVGIGTTTPAQALDVNGVINAAGGYKVNNAVAAIGTYLRGNGTNFVPSAIQAGDVPTLNQNTTGTAANVTGTVAVAHGGTGAATSPTSGGVIYAANATTYASTAAGTTGQVLISNGASAPTWANATASAWGLTGNSGTIYRTNFIGTTDAQDLQFRIGGVQAGLIEGAADSDNRNTGLGYGVLLSNTTGNGNTASGYEALKSNTTGYTNTASGVVALFYNTTGNSNTASGTAALEWNTTGNFNTSSGNYALYQNTTGSNNTALGYIANVASGALTNATAIGANAYVAASNSLVLGSISGVNGASASTNVGIGTTAPAAMLSVGTGSALRVDSSGNLSTSGSVNARAGMIHNYRVDSTGASTLMLNSRDYIVKVTGPGTTGVTMPTALANGQIIIVMNSTGTTFTTGSPTARVTAGNAWMMVWDNSAPAWTHIPFN